MKDLKELLFQKTNEAFEAYQRCQRHCPEADWELYRRTFCALYGLIDEAGLEEEYQTWKEAL